MIAAISRVRPHVLTLLLGLALLAMLLAWSVLLPLAGAPDEPAHYIYAAAVVRGQLGMLDVQVPASIADIVQYSCLAYNQSLIATCQDAIVHHGSEITNVTTYVGLYNPVFYWLTGWVTLLIDGPHGLYAARAVSSVVEAALLGWGLSLLVRRGAAWAVGCFLFVLTPMALFIAGSYNPNGWEIAAAMALASALVTMIIEHRAGIEFREAIVLFGISGSVLAVSRGLSTLWLAAFALTALIALGIRPLGQLLATRRGWISPAAVALAAILSVLWIARVGTNYVGTGMVPTTTLKSFLSAFALVMDKGMDYVRQHFGHFGWLDLPAPTVIALIWFGVIAALIGIALVVGPLRWRLAIIFLALFLFLVPPIIVAKQWSGIGWQGRYTIPVLGFLMILVGYAIDRFAPPLSTRRWAGGAPLATVLIIWGAGQVSMFVLNIHRYLVGGLGGWNPLTTPLWTPPLPAGMLLFVTLAGAVSLILLSWATVSAGPRLAGAPESRSSVSLK